MKDVAHRYWGGIFVIGIKIKEIGVPKRVDVVWREPCKVFAVVYSVGI